MAGKLKVRTDELETSKEKLATQADALRMAHDKLELRVQKRTEQLARINKELEEEIAEHKRDQKALKESEKKYRTQFEEALDAIFIAESETGTIIDCNQAGAELVGRAKSELIGKPQWILHPSEEIEGKLSRTFKEHLNQKEAQALETHVITKKGKTRDVSIKANIFELKGKKVVQGTFRDITDQKQAEEALRRVHEGLEIRVQERTEELTKANAQLRYEITERQAAEAELLQAKEVAETANLAKSEFLANMSHELRTPLNHVIGFTELVVDKHPGDLNETQEEYLTDVLSSSKHLLSLINDILDLSKVEAGKMEIKPSDVNLKMLVDNSLTMVKEKAMKHGIQLSADIKEIPEIITADERKLKQVIYNLLSNAVKFTPDAGTIRVETRAVDYSVRPGLRRRDPEDFRLIDPKSNKGEPAGTQLQKCVEFSISDTGIGITPEDMGRIFSPFEQVENSTSRRYQGTGLGLSLTKGLVELHGGIIWAESEGAGKGSIFRFIIPV
jgi:PAS domain S-box-containing protein